MLRRFVLSAALVVLVASSAGAQDKRGEFWLNLGGTMGSGINSNEVAPSGQAKVFVEAVPKNSFSWGLDLGYFASESIEIGALYSAQKSELQFTVGSNFKQVGEGLDVQNMMGTIAWHSGDLGSKTRFYVLGGLGATRYGEVSFVGPNGNSAETSGKSKFATTWGVGIKSYPSPKLGLKLGFRWTPTNLGETADEWLCSPYYPTTCTVDGSNSQYAHQYEFSAGIALRF